MKKLLVAVVAIVAVLVAPAFAATRKLTVDDNFFVRKKAPHSATVNKGTTVKWVWRGNRKHNVYQLSGPGHFHSPTRRSGTYPRKFNKAGAYKFFCTVYPSMRMSLRVK